MASPYIKDIKVKNYRIFEHFEADGFRRVNLIGGVNGGGKSTLLESLFFMMDRGNVLALLRPLQWRQLPVSLNFARETLYSNEKEKSLSITSTTREGRSEVRYIWEPQRLPQNHAVNIGTGGPNGAPPSLDAKSDSSMEGFTAEVRESNRVVLRRGMVPEPDGFKGVDFLNEPIVVPNCVMLGRYTMHYANDIAQRYSEVARAGRKAEIIDMARRVNSQITDLELFQIGSGSYLYVRLQKGAMVPATLAGDGVLTMLSIGLAIMNSPKGVVLLDEFDAAIHYSMLAEVWSFITNLSKEYDCQVFAATHSREAIDAALDGVLRNKQMKDFAYYRLDRFDSRSIATRYEAEELVNASSNGWEVR